MATVAPQKEIIDAIKAAGGDAFKSCYQCCMCDTVCPWSKVSKFSMRKVVREATFGLTEIDGEDIWRCTTCGKCPQVCPRDVKQIESGVALRRIATEYDVFPQSVQPIRRVSANLRAEGNPFGEDRLADELAHAEVPDPVPRADGVAHAALVAVFKRITAARLDGVDDFLEGGYRLHAFSHPCCFTVMSG